MKFEFDTRKYIDELQKGSNYFHTFINKDTLAAGVLVLQPGEKDTQAPHDSDELYYVIRGNGYLKIDKKDYTIEEGKTFFVPKNMEHYFFGNTKELVVIYFFGGPDS
ncbi:MAG: cupin domain-containing protein [Nitrososphaerota archaeon]